MAERFPNTEEPRSISSLLALCVLAVASEQLPASLIMYSHRVCPRPRLQSSRQKKRKRLKKKKTYSLGLSGDMTRPIFKSMGRGIQNGAYLQYL